MLMPSATLSSWSSAPPTSAENTVLPSTRTRNSCGRSCPSTPNKPSSTPRTSRPENTYSPSAGNVCADARAAASAERHAVQMLVLRQLERDAVRRGRHGSVGIADGHVRDAQRDREIALEQQRRRRQNLGDVVEAEVAAVARQQRRQDPPRRRASRERHSRIRRDSAGARSWRRRTDSPRQRRRACPRGPSTNCATISSVGLRLLARRHRVDRQLAQHLFPDRGIGVHVVEAAALERQIGRELGVVVAIDAVAVEHRPLLLQLGFAATASSRNRLRCARDNATPPPT